MLQGKQGLFCLWFSLWFVSCSMYNLERQAQRLDDLELKLLMEGKHRRADIFEIRSKTANLEAFLYSYSNGTRPDETFAQRQETDTPKARTGNDSLELFQFLQKGFQAEKELNARTRRHIKELDTLLGSLTYNTGNITEDLEQVKLILNELTNTANEVVIGQKDMMGKAMPEMLAELNGVKSTVDEYLRSTKRPKSCSDLLRSGHNSSGLYKVYPGTWTDGIQVYCDQVTDGGGWTVFQRREDGFLDFYRGWLDYKLGFGSLLGEFWLGNENIHHLTAECCHEIRVDLADFRGNQRHAFYNSFKVGHKTGNYVLTAEGYSGDAGNSLSEHNGAPFSTKDHGQSQGCSATFKGGWWYTKCHSANLNGLYLHGNHTSYADGIEWKAWTGYYYSLKFVEMKFREKK